MKLTTFILIISLMQVSAATFGQKVTLKQSNITFEKVFREVMKQTGYDVLVSTAKFKPTAKIDVDFKEASIQEIMAKIIENTDLTYTVEDKTVVIKEQEKRFFDKIMDKLHAIDVRGRVVDAEGKPLLGASVKVKGLNKVVSTNANGEFRLANVDEGAILVISFIGYVTKEVPAAATTMGNITLLLSDSKLDEVQVIAYGTTTRRLSTGNISSIKAEDIAKSPVSNPILALQGRVPGVYVEQSSGIPGGNVKVRIQGTNSIRNGNNPLYIIDGVPFVSTLLPSVATVLGTNSGADGPGSPLSLINPSDIESW